MTITNKSLAKQLAKTIKMFDVKLWELSGAKYSAMLDARTKTCEALSALGYQLQSDYTLITNSVNSVIESVDLPQEQDEDGEKTIFVIGHTVIYWYEDEFNHEIQCDDSDFEMLVEKLSEGFIEGELHTMGTWDEDERIHSGWWKILK